VSRVRSYVACMTSNPAIIPFDGQKVTPAQRFILEAIETPARSHAASDCSGTIRRNRHRLPDGALPCFDTSKDGPDYNGAREEQDAENGENDGLDGLVQKRTLFCSILGRRRIHDEGITPNGGRKGRFRARRAGEGRQEIMTKKTITRTRPYLCTVCGGDGIDPRHAVPSSEKPCPNCEGTGILEIEELETWDEEEPVKKVFGKGDGVPGVRTDYSKNNGKW